jgi:adenylate cyclase
MGKNKKLSSILAIGIGFVVIIIAFLCFLSALSWIGKPFPGFLMYKFPYVGSMGSTDWSGIKDGLKVMDRIISINGVPIRQGENALEIIEKSNPDDPFLYKVESKGKTWDITIPPERFRQVDFFMVFFLPFLGGLLVFAIGLIVLLLKPNIASSWVFFLFSLVVGLYMATGFEMQSTYRFVALHYFLIPFQGAVLFHLGLIFPEKKQFLNRFPFLEYAVYIPALLLALCFEIQLMGLKYPGFPLAGMFPSVNIITAYSRFFILLGVLGFIVSVLFSYLKTSSNVVKLRAKMIFFGVTLAFLPVVGTFFVIHFLKVTFPINFLIFFVLSFPATMGYSIVRHNLFDADTLIRRTVGYAVVTAVLVGSYALISLGLSFLIGDIRVAQSKAFPILFTLAFIMIFNPLRNRIQTLVDKLFFRKEYDAKKIIDRIGSAMTSLMDLPQILRQMVRTFSQEMFIDNSAVLLLNPAGTTYQVYQSEGEKKTLLEGVRFERNEALPQVIEEEKKELTRYDVLEDPKYKELCLDCAQNFSSLFASLIVPLVLRGEVIGFISLGEKKSGKFYNREDIDLLRTLASQGAVAIENARMADQMKNEELVRANLARYLSPQIVDQIIKNDVQVNLGGDRKEVTVLFSDIRNFTSISESMNPDQLVSFLNEYFTEMARIIFENQGSLDKYIGDAIVAVFGSLIPLENSAEAAVQASIEMMGKMGHLNEKWKERYGFNMEMGIGINTGEVFLGNIGSPERMEFTVIGDTVNTASRFSGLAKGRQILATRSARERLGAEFQITQLPATRVKGKAEEVDVYEINY